MFGFLFICAAASILVQLLVTRKGGSISDVASVAWCEYLNRHYSAGSTCDCQAPASSALGTMSAEGNERPRSRPGNVGGVGSPPSKKKRNGKHAAGGQATSVRAPQLKEPWRKAAKSRQLLAEPALGALHAFLDEDISVVPQAGSLCLPTLTVTPGEMIRHVLARMSYFVAETKPGAGVFAEIYGGVAQSVVSVNNGLEAPAPTDFDVRFYIPRAFNDSRDFDRCRYIVEEFLVMKLRLALEGCESELQVKAPNLVRTRYYQKQVVIGDALSLLSVGDPATGKGVDLEFSLNVEGNRKYFDDANSFVIPLSLQHLAGAQPVHALSMASNFEHAVSLASNRELLVGQPAQVVNGLSLYVHALSDKGLTPAAFSTEERYGAEMVASFLATCRELRQRSSDPLRFLKSFIRSHYPSRPLACLAMVAQLMAELSAYSSISAEGSERDADRGGWDTIDECAELVCAHLLTAVESMRTEPEGLRSLLAIACFVRSPGNMGAAPAAERSVRLRCEGGREARLLRKSNNCASNCAILCRRAAPLLREGAAEMEAWKQGVVESICQVFVSESLPPEAPVHAAKPPAHPATAPGDQCVTVGGIAVAAVRKPMSYAAAALSVVANEDKGKEGPGHVALAPRNAWLSHATLAPAATQDQTHSDAPAAEAGAAAVPQEVGELERESGLRRAVGALLRRLGLGYVAASLEQEKAPVEEEATVRLHTDIAPRAVDVCDGAKRVEEAMKRLPANAHAVWLSCGTSPTTSTEHSWDGRELAAEAPVKLPSAQAAHAVVTGDAPSFAAKRPHVQVNIELVETDQKEGQSAGSSGFTTPLASDVRTSRGCWSQDDVGSEPSSPISKRSSGRSKSSASNLALSGPLFSYRGLFDSPEYEQPMVQVDSPLCRLLPAEREDSDVDGSPLGSTPTGADTPTSGASSDAASDLALESLVRAMLGDQGYTVDPPAFKTRLNKDYSMTKDYRWALADQWATSGLQSFPAPWCIE